jgi:hypothetical protein
MSTVTDLPTLRTLARKEIGNYLRSKLYWFGAGLLAIVSVVGLTAPDDRFSTVGDGIAPAALIGLFGIVIMASLTRNSDRAAEAAGAVSVGQRTRTLALACAAVVPFATGLLWYVTAVIGYNLHPPAPSGVPFGSMNDMFVYAIMFQEGVTACVGGPILGLVIGRWLPQRWVAPVIAVAIVPITMVMQPLFEWPEHWRQVWIWIHFYGAGGTEEDPDRALRFTGSPYFYILYLAALCVLGVLIALYRDPDADRTGLRKTLAGVAAAAAVLCILAMVVGPNERQVNPVPSPTAES